MARKTRTCTASKIETILGALKIRKCMLGRLHSGRHWDGEAAFDVEN